MKFYFSILILFSSLAMHGQSNPGFMGKHHSIGAFVQFTSFYKDRRYITPTIKAEHTLKRHLSIEGSIGFFSKTFTPELERDYMNFTKAEDKLNGQIYTTRSIAGIATFKGFQSQIGMVLYLRSLGSMAPYGKRLSIGYFLNRSSITKDNLIYTCDSYSYKASAHQTLTIKPQNEAYRPRSISGFYLEMGEKRVSKNNLFLQYSLQFTVPLSYNYPTKTYLGFKNNQDFLEVKMRRNIIRNNLLCAFIGVGFLLR